nr:MAG TPA: hypothetical protein [Caudoviricetes sp.]
MLIIAADSASVVMYKQKTDRRKKKYIRCCYKQGRGNQIAGKALAARRRDTL